MGLNRSEFPILEFDNNRDAIINPGRNKWDIKLPEKCVMTFFGDVVEKYCINNGCRILASTKWETGTSNIYEIEYKGEKIAVFHAWVGAPIAVGLMEFAIAYGTSKIIACGGCGVLDRKITAGHILMPTSAVRDEGTSYHYLPAAREVEIDKIGVDAIKKVVRRNKLKYIECKTWTTDAFYRETNERVSLRKLEGCLCVEMECSALSAAAKFRGVNFAQILYSGDNLDSDDYDSRDWQNNISARERLFLLSLEACLEL